MRYVKATKIGDFDIELTEVQAESVYEVYYALALENGITVDPSDTEEQLKEAFFDAGMLVSVLAIEDKK